MLIGHRGSLEVQDLCPREDFTELEIKSIVEVNVEARGVGSGVGAWSTCGITNVKWRRGKC